MRAIQAARRQLDMNDTTTTSTSTAMNNNGQLSSRMSASRFYGAAKRPRQEMLSTSSSSNSSSLMSPVTRRTRTDELFDTVRNSPNYNHSSSTSYSYGRGNRNGYSYNSSSNNNYNNNYSPPHEMMTGGNSYSAGNWPPAKENRSPPRYRHGFTTGYSPRGQNNNRNRFDRSRNDRPFGGTRYNTNHTGSNPYYQKNSRFNNSNGGYNNNSIKYQWNQSPNNNNSGSGRLRRPIGNGNYSSGPNQSYSPRTSPKRARTSPRKHWQNQQKNIMTSFTPQSQRRPDSIQHRLGPKRQLFEGANTGSAIKRGKFAIHSSSSLSSAVTSSISTTELNSTTNSSMSTSSTTTDPLKSNASPTVRTTTSTTSTTTASSHCSTSTATTTTPERDNKRLFESPNRTGSPTSDGHDSGFTSSPSPPTCDLGSDLSNTTQTGSSPHFNSSHLPLVSPIKGPMQERHPDNIQNNPSNYDYSDDETNVNIIDPDCPTPLINLGNTCYMNSLIQSLFYLPDFMDNLTQSYAKLHTTTSDDKRMKMTRSLIELHKKYLELRNEGMISDQVFAPVKEALLDLKSSVGERADDFKFDNRQQDAVEFYDLIMDSINDEFKAVGAKDLNTVERWMSHKKRDTISCTSDACDYKRELPAESDLVLRVHFSNDATDDKSLEYKLTEFVRGSLLDKEAGTCPKERCGKSLCRKSTFTRLPRFLCIQLNRFLRNKDGFVDKRTNLVEAPLHLTIPRDHLDLGAPVTVTANESTFLPSPPSPASSSSSVDEGMELDARSESSKENEEIDIPLLNNHLNSKVGLYKEVDGVRYRLLSVIRHIGLSIEMGHYTSSLYDPKTRKWFSCNDRVITMMNDFKEVRDKCKKSGYFYMYVMDPLHQTVSTPSPVKETMSSMAEKQTLIPVATPTPLCLPLPTPSPSPPPAPSCVNPEPVPAS